MTQRCATREERETDKEDWYRTAKPRVDAQAATIRRGEKARSGGAMSPWELGGRSICG